MSLSFDALSPEHKLVFLLEGLAGQDGQAPLACRVCDRIFYNNRTLLNHFLSDHNDTDKGLGLGLGLGSGPRRSHVRNMNGPRLLHVNDQSGGSHEMHGGSAVRLTGSTVVPTTFSGKNSSSVSRNHRDRRVLEDYSLSGRTRPYIRQLEVPIKDRVAGGEEISGDRLSDEMDLTIKL